MRRRRGTAALTPVLPGTVPPGDMVQSVFGSLLAAPGVGIAITSLTGSSYGTWQYATYGTHWTAMPAVSSGKPLRLTAGDWLRFVPKAGFVGTVTFTAPVWDGGSEYSSTTLTASLVNTAPVLNG